MRPLRALFDDFVPDRSGRIFLWTFLWPQKKLACANADAA